MLYFGYLEQVSHAKVVSITGKLLQVNWTERMFMDGEKFRTQKRKYHLRGMGKDAYWILGENMKGTYKDVGRVGGGYAVGV